MRSKQKDHGDDHHHTHNHHHAPCPQGKPIDIKMQQSLLCAAREGDVRRVRHLVSSGEADPNTGSSRVRATALHEACKGQNPFRPSTHGHMEVVRYLVEEVRVEVDVLFGPGCMTPLHFAAIKGEDAASMAITKILVEKGGANVEARTRTGTTPLHYASWRGDLDKVRYLVEVCGADVHGASAWGSALHHAMKKGVAPGPDKPQRLSYQRDVIRYLMPLSKIGAEELKIAWEKQHLWCTKVGLAMEYAKAELGRSIDKHPYVMQTLLACPLPSTEAFMECVEKPCDILFRRLDDSYRLPLHASLELAKTQKFISPAVIRKIAEREPRAARVKDLITGFFPFQAAVVVANRSSFDELLGGPKKENHIEWLDLVYILLRCHDPSVLATVKK